MATKKKTSKKNNQNDGEAYRPAKIEIQDTVLVSFKELVVDDAANSRLDYDDKKIEALAADIKRRGLINPPLVISTRDKKKPFRLVAGYCRVRALKHLGFEDTQARVVEGELEPKDIYILNVTENTSREDLSTYEKAVACYRLSKDFGISGASIGTQLGMTKATANNYIRCIRELLPEIQAAWRAGDNENCTTANMIALSAQSKEQQKAKWDDLNGLTPQVSGDESGEGDKPATLKAGKRDMKKALKAIEEHAGPDHPSAQALKFALGLTPKLFYGDQLLWAVEAKKND